MNAELIVYFFQGKFDEEDNDGWHFGVESHKDIPTSNYVLFCDYLQDALSALEMSESEAEKKHFQRLI